jgi:hypothetical protein
MTTSKVTRIFSPDLFCDNQAILLDRQRATQIADRIVPLSALTFLARRSDNSVNLRELAFACCVEAVAVLTGAQSLNGYCFWAFISDGPWRQDNRIENYRRLWRNRSQLTDSAGILRIGEEARFTSQDGIRFAGLLQVTGEALIQALEASRVDPACAVLYSKSETLGSQFSVQTLFSAAFPKQGGSEQVKIDWLSFALKRCSHGDVLLRVSGLFDDREAAVDLIGAQAVVEGLRSRVT